MNLNIILSVPFLLLASGCVTNSSVADKIVSNSNANLAEATLSEWKLGDRVTYGNGRSERVIKVDGKQVFWKKTKTTKFTTTHNFVEPQLHYESKTRIINKKVINFGGSNHPDELWPLKIDNSVNIYYNNAYANLKVATYFKNSMKQMECSVDDTTTIQVLAGKFDVYVVNCQKIYTSGNKGTRYTYYYAPFLGHWVYKITKTKKKQYEKELMRLVRGTRWLSRNERKSLKVSLQNVMENNQTGQKNTWQSRDGKTIVESHPTKTMKLETGAFCRNYVQVIKKAGKTSQSAGLLCRDNSKQWKSPKREKVAKLGFKGFFK